MRLGLQDEGRAKGTEEIGLSASTAGPIFDLLPADRRWVGVYKKGEGGVYEFIRAVCPGNAPSEPLVCVRHVLADWGNPLVYFAQAPARPPVYTSYFVCVWPRSWIAVR